MPVDETTKLRPNDWSSLEVRLVDLSAEGFRAECEATMLRGSAIRIELPGIGEVEAQLTWHRGGEIGARFIVPIDLSRCKVAGVSGETVLARLLVQRAGALSAGRYDQEQALRARILAALPMRRIEG
jgi:hypothetical protein